MTLFAAAAEAAEAKASAERRRKKRRKRRKHRVPHHITTSTSSRPTAPAVVPIVTPASPLLSPNALHLARRFSFGVNPALGQAVNGAGGARAWLVSQLDPASVPDPAGDAINTWFDYRSRTPYQIWQRQSAGIEGSWVVMWSLSKWTVSRRIHSTRQVHEVMTDFWSNLFNVPLGNSNGAAYPRPDYDNVIRTYALTSFEQLLQHVITHPAMGINLSNNISNANSSAGANENLGRELLELHTVGFGAGYTEADVKASAKMLSGYRVDTWPYNDFGGYYPAWHYVGPLTIFGFSHANASSDGRAATAAYLSYLARHPLTAARIARRLCVRFVQDNPSDDLVNTVAAAYTANNTAIQPTILAMVDHPDFNASAGKKLRTPQEDWQAMVRALGIGLQQPTGDSSFVNSMYWQYQQLGAAPYEWAAPNGYPEVGAAWSSAGRMLNSFDNHREMAFHWWPAPNNGASTPDVRAFLPPLPATLQNVIDVLGVQVVGQAPGAQTSQAIAALLGKSLSYVVTVRDGSTSNYWFVPSIVSTLLDSPQHLYR